jgi:hypothetical protein
LGALGEGPGALRCAIPDPHAAEPADLAQGEEVIPGEDAGAEEGEVAGVFSGEGSSGEGGDGGGAAGGELAAFEDAQELAVFGFEEEDCALVAFEAGGVGAGEDGDGFDRQAGRLFGEGGHDAEQAFAVGPPEDVAQRVDGAALR